MPRRRKPHAKNAKHAKSKLFPSQKSLTQRRRGRRDFFLVAIEASRRGAEDAKGKFSVAKVSRRGAEGLFPLYPTSRKGAISHYAGDHDRELLIRGLSGSVASGDRVPPALSCPKFYDLVPPPL